MEVKLRSRILIGSSVLLGSAALALFLGLRPTATPWAADASAETAAEPAPSGPEVWPAKSVSLKVVNVAFPEGFGTRRIYVDAGHGAEGNPGNTSSFCVDEQDFTLDVSRKLASYLERTGHFEVELSRKPGELTNYHRRVDEAEAWKADAFISIHSDVRGDPEKWAPEPGLECLRTHDAPGFSVLWSDEGSDELNAARLGLARHIAAQMAEAGFPKYGGREYEGLYEADSEQDSVFVDRHEMDKRIFVLRRPTMASVIVETHNALDSREAERWEEPETREAFHAAMAASLIEALR